MKKDYDLICVGMALVDSLLQHLPVTENKLEIKKKECINDLYHNYPAFRAVPEYVLQSVWAGDGTDNKKEQAANFAAVTPASLAAFSRENSVAISTGCGFIITFTLNSGCCHGSCCSSSSRVSFRTRSHTSRSLNGT